MEQNKINNGAEVDTRYRMAIPIIFITNNLKSRDEMIFIVLYTQKVVEQDLNSGQLASIEIFFYQVSCTKRLYIENVFKINLRL